MGKKVKEYHSNRQWARRKVVEYHSDRQCASRRLSIIGIGKLPVEGIRVPYGWAVSH